MEAVGDEVDSDQVLHWMTWIAEALGELDQAERSELVSTARQLADEADNEGDHDRAEAYRRIADAEDPA